MVRVDEVGVVAANEVRLRDVHVFEHAGEARVRVGGAWLASGFKALAITGGG